MDGSETLPDGHTTSSIEMNGETPGELGVEVETGSPKKLIPR
jgi:hypothetical protein